MDKIQNIETNVPQTQRETGISGRYVPTSARNITNSNLNSPNSVDNTAKTPLRGRTTASSYNRALPDGIQDNMQTVAQTDSGLTPPDCSAILDAFVIQDIKIIDEAKLLQGLETLEHEYGSLGTFNTTNYMHSSWSNEIGQPFLIGSPGCTTLHIPEYRENGIPHFSITISEREGVFIEADKKDRRLLSELLSRHNFFEICQNYLEQAIVASNQPLNYNDVSKKYVSYDYGDLVTNKPTADEIRAKTKSLIAAVKKVMPKKSIHVIYHYAEPELQLLPNLELQGYDPHDSAKRMESIAQEFESIGESFKNISPEIRPGSGTSKITADTPDFDKNKPVDPSEFNSLEDIRRIAQANPDSIAPECLSILNAFQVQGIEIANESELIQELKNYQDMYERSKSNSATKDPVVFPQYKNLSNAIAQPVLSLSISQPNGAHLQCGPHLQLYVPENREEGIPFFCIRLSWDGHALIETLENHQIPLITDIDDSIKRPYKNILKSHSSTISQKMWTPNRNLLNNAKFFEICSNCLKQSLVSISRLGPSKHALHTVGSLAMNKSVANNVRTKAEKLIELIKNEHSRIAASNNEIFPAEATPESVYQKWFLNDDGSIGMIYKTSEPGADPRSMTRLFLTELEKLKNSDLTKPSTPGTGEPILPEVDLFPEFGSPYNVE